MMASVKLTYKNSVCKCCWNIATNEWGVISFVIQYVSQSIIIINFQVMIKVWGWL